MGAVSPRSSADPLNHGALVRRRGARFKSPGLRRAWQRLCPKHAGLSRHLARRFQLTAPRRRKVGFSASAPFVVKGLGVAKKYLCSNLLV